jgi:hypothetical protein
MTDHAYPNSAMVSDYLRAAAGFVPAAAIFAMPAAGAATTGVAAGFAALFLLFGMRTALRHATHIVADGHGIAAAGPLAATIPWAGLDRMKLAYYSTRRDRRDGWMQMELRAGGSRLRFDSRIDGFEALAARAAHAAVARGLELDVATIANLEALGIGATGFDADRARGGE